MSSEEGRKKPIFLLKITNFVFIDLKKLILQLKEYLLSLLRFIDYIGLQFGVHNNTLSNGRLCKNLISYELI